MLRLEKLDTIWATFLTRIPFGIFEIPGILDLEDYTALDREFPASDRFGASYDNGQKSYLDNTMPGFFSFLETSPSWSRLYRQFADPAVTQKLYALARHFPCARPAHETLPWTLVIDPASPNPTRDAAANDSNVQEKARRARTESRTPVRIAFEFSHLRDGGFVAPHTDVPPKLISLMLYFPDQDVAYGPDAGTVFYTGRDRQPAEAAWEVFMLEPETAGRFLAAHDVFHRAPFIANHLVGFVKSDISWHGLEPVKLPPGAARRSVNINYFCI